MEDSVEELLNLILHTDPVESKDGTNLAFSLMPSPEDMDKLLASICSSGKINSMQNNY